MALVGYVQPVTGGLTDPNPSVFTITVTDDKATVEASNYFIDLLPKRFKNGDMVLVVYGYDKTKGLGTGQLYALDMVVDGKGKVTQTVRAAFPDPA